MLQATLQVLKRHGLKGLTTTSVAARAGVSVGTLYQYFPDKQSLVSALKVQYFERVVDAVREAAAQVTGRPLEEAIPIMIRALLDMKRQNLDLTLALRESMATTGGASLAREAVAALHGATANVLKAARPDLRQIDLRARVLNAAIEGVIAGVVSEDPRHLASQPIADELIRLALAYAKA